MNKIILAIVGIAIAAVLVIQPTQSASSSVAPGTYEYVLGRWVWEVEKDGFSYWRAPDCTDASIDLRTIPQMAQAGGIPQGYGYFAIDARCPVPLGSISLGNDIAATVPAITTAAVESVYRLPAGTLSGETVAGVPWRLLTDMADPTGDSGPKPIMPDSRLNVTMRLARHSIVRTERFDPTKHTRVLDVLRNDYERIKSESLVRGDELYLKAAGAWVEKYGFDVRTEEQKADGIRTPETIITETWDCPDSDSLTCDLTWTEVSGDTDIITNRASQQTTNDTVTARAESDLSSADHYSQATMNFDGLVATQAGPAGRFDNAADTMYWASLNGGSPYASLFKRMAGTNTGLGDDTSTSISANTDYLIKLEMNGSNIEFFREGSSVFSVTDSSIPGNVRAGLAGFQAAANRARWDNLEAADLAAPSPRRIINILTWGYPLWERTPVYLDKGR